MLFRCSCENQIFQGDNFVIVVLGTIHIIFIKKFKRCEILITIKTKTISYLDFFVSPKKIKVVKLQAI